MNFHIDGIVPIIPTPFDESEAICWPELDRLIEFAIHAGACAVCLPAYASEFYKLSEEERLELTRRAVVTSAGRVPVIAQVNYASTRLSITAARRAIEAGASAFCSATPRQFALSDADLLRHFTRLLSEVDAPFILQDFNPGGSSMSIAALAELNRAFPHFRYVKLEEPHLAGKVAALRDATAGRVGVLEGWGGMYTLELAPAGIAGVVPGLGLTDLLVKVFQLARAGAVDSARSIFEGILPQILYSLQNMELFHHTEKLLLQARGVLRQTRVRAATVSLTDHDRRYIQLLNERVLQLLREHHLSPAGLPAAQEAAL